MLGTDAAALALGVELRTLDNILAREARSLLPAGRRGRRRQISERVLHQVAIALLLARDAGVGIARGLELARALIDSPDRDVPLGALGALRFDVDALRRVLHEAMADAAGESPPRKRGRPARNAKRGVR